MVCFLINGLELNARAGRKYKGWKKMYRLKLYQGLILIIKAEINYMGWN
jgi:hypothetical protein